MKIDPASFLKMTKLFLGMVFVLMVAILIALNTYILQHLGFVIGVVSFVVFLEGVMILGFLLNRQINHEIHKINARGQSQ